VKLVGVAVFAAGYVIGARAGRERYVQIVNRLASASQKLEEFSARRPSDRRDHGPGGADGDSRSQETPV
jgi:hypothetical protein